MKIVLTRKVCEVIRGPSAFKQVRLFHTSQEEQLSASFLAEDKGSKQTAYIQLAGTVILLIGGIYLVGKKK